MSLDGNAEISKQAFVKAMKERLETLDDQASKDIALQAINEKKGEVQKNLGALGQAVYSILTDHAETTSSLSNDSDFWQWIQLVNAWLKDLSTWQEGVEKSFRDWQPGSEEGKDLKNKLLKLNSPKQPPNSPPKSLRGKIQ